MYLEVGMWVRYKYENCIYIGKIKFISEVMCGLDETLQIDIDNCMEEILKIDILKASHNIIDLIEVGDYVNGYPVYEILEYSDNTKAIVIGDDNKSIIWEESSQYIKSIVTKEQFESMSYKVGD